MFDAINRLLEDAVGAQPAVAHIDTTTFQHLRPEELFFLLDLIPTPIMLAMNPSATDIRSNSAGYALFRSDRSQNLSQWAPEEERPSFGVWSNDKVIPFESLPMQHAALTGKSVRGSECELRFADGEVRYISGNVDPVFAPDGSIRGSIGAFLDITRLKTLERENSLLTREIAHRARNSVSLIQMLARQSLKPKLSTADYGSFESRLVSLGHSVEISLPSSEGALTIERVTKAALEPLVGADNPRVKVRGPSVQLSARDVMTLSMSIHELTTNASKYGALSNSDGTVSISWTQPKGKDAVIVDWIERGGPAVTAPAREGFGTKLLTTLIGSLGESGVTSYDPAGLEHRLVLAIAPQIARADLSN